MQGNIYQVVFYLHVIALPMVHFATCLQQYPIDTFYHTPSTIPHGYILPLAFNNTPWVHSITCLQQYPMGTFYHLSSTISYGYILPLTFNNTPWIHSTTYLFTTCLYYSVTTNHSKWNGFLQNIIKHLSIITKTITIV